GEVGVEQHVVDPQLRGEVDVDDAAPAVLVGVDEQLVAGDAGVVHDRVDPRLRAVAGGDVLGAPPAGVRHRDVQLQGAAADLVGHRAQRLAAGRDVHDDDVRAVTGEGPRDGGPDAAGGAGDDDDPALERPVPLGVPVERHLGRTDPPGLARHVGRAALEQEQQGGGEGLGRGGRVDPDQVGGGPAAQLLADAADDALQRLLGGRGL